MQAIESRTFVYKVYLGTNCQAKILVLTKSFNIYTILVPRAACHS